MSVELETEVDGRVLEVKLSGKLSTEDYEHLVPEVERLVRKYGQIRILVHMHDFHGWSCGALWQDIKFDLKHFSDVERVALVGDSDWEAGMAMFCKPFTSAKVRYFDKSNCDEAFTWIHEELIVDVGLRNT